MHSTKFWLYNIKYTHIEAAQVENDNSISSNDYNCKSNSDHKKILSKSYMTHMWHAWMHTQQLTKMV